MSKIKSIFRFIAVFTFLLSFSYHCDESVSPTKPIDDDLVGRWIMNKFTIIDEQPTVIEEAELQLLGVYWLFNFNLI